MKPVVAIVGRANVGKSTLFNRLCGGRHAIVEDVSGVTRDRLYRDGDWLGREFTLIDTGGIEFNTKENPFADKVKEQAVLAIDEADLIIFLVDAKTGVTDTDQEVAGLLRRQSKPVILAVNKVDNFADLSPVYDFYQLGIGEPIPISATHGMNTGDLLDTMVALLPEGEAEEKEGDYLPLALVGRPNVGKSSLVNRLLGEERVIVSDIPGTTRDAIDSVLQKNGREYLIIDTAGMRKKGKIAETTERYSVARGLKAVNRCDVAILVLDAASGLAEQDKKIAGFIDQAGKGLLILVNKWDLPEKDEKTMDRFDADLKQELGFASYALTLYVSAKSGKRLDKILPLADFISEQHSRRVATARLNEVIREAGLLNPPPLDGGRRLKLLYATQVGVKPPTIVIFVNEPKILHFSYERYIENKLRENFGFAGTPIRLLWRKREREE
ncbi:MAG: ribosome biogenesis GTPase Der [Clostridiales bacterium]|nr:ribosome biogenesis GTPase Der [Clostridiales bacterium]